MLVCVYVVRMLCTALAYHIIAGLRARVSLCISDIIVALLILVRVSVEPGPIARIV